jgi:homopolymeric O-antigen transport system permease protein
LSTAQEHLAQPVQPTRIAPPSRWGNTDLRELWKFRDLLVILMMRDVKLRYKQTALGIAWVVLQPLVASLIFAAIFGLFARLPSNGIAYLPFVFAGMLPWNLFSGALQRGGNSLVVEARLISKVYFPRAIIPIASCAAVLVDFAVALIVMLALLIGYRIPITLNLLALPLFLLMVLFLAIGASLLFSAFNVYYRDFTYALPFIVQVWMYASPVVYSAELIPGQLRSIYALNPLVGVIDGFRWSLVGAGTFPWTTSAISIGIGVLLLVGASIIFQRVEQHFADVI